MMPVDRVQNSALELFKESLRTSRISFTLDVDDVSTFSGENPIRNIPTDPETLQYLRDLITFILNGRTIIFTYNIALLVILVLFSLLHLKERIKEKSKWRIIEQESTTGSECLRKTADSSEIIDENEAESSSSSTLEGSLSSQGTFKRADADVERQPLLGTQRRQAPSENSSGCLVRGLKPLLMYQPQPIPLINRTLPSNGTSLFVLAFMGLNVFYHFYQLPLESKFFFAFADRAGIVFVVNLPILYLLGAKNQPLKLLTGHSYEALIIYHRRVGELLCFEAFVHFASMLIWQVWLSPSWLKTGSFYHYITHPLVLLGLGAFVSYELLYFTSLGSFRERWYEIFLASHVVLQIAALAFLWLHFFTSRPYVLASLVIFLVDRLVWRLWMKSARFTADLTVLDDDQTLFLSADWDIPSGGRQCMGPLRQSIRHGWHPADHVFVSIPVLGRSHSLQAHPFTIASAAPVANCAQSSNHAWLGLLIRVQSGFTSNLLDYARSNSRVDVRLDGPYGSQDPLNMLRSCENAVLVAGGSGIAVTFPMAWSLATTHRGKRQVHLFWVIHSRTQLSWIPEERIAELRKFGVHVTIPEPTNEAGRPDITGYVADLASISEGRLGMVVSGPDGLNRTARNACSEAVRSGADIQLRVEKFGW
ncbi:hypothetical protein F4804DRAFT_309140 [Jackrogersella minutella]|nr:hypothetical protein F4804DRAFT_309140 [Jackrogersella minutella]